MALERQENQSPPLRDRTEDIPELVRHFLAQDKARKKEIGDDAMQVLQEYPWPGNVRELKRVCEQLLLIAPLPVLRREDVLQVIRPPAQVSAGATSVDLGRGLAELVNEFESQIIQKALSQQNDIDEVARLLKISRSSLYKKIKDHGIGATHDLWPLAQPALCSDRGDRDWISGSALCAGVFS